MARLRRGQDRRSLSAFASELELLAADRATSAMATGAGSGTGWGTGTWSELFPGWLINAALGWAAAQVEDHLAVVSLSKP